MNKKLVTMKDIAQKAGVSVSTVSHVISKTRHVAQETRELVLRTVDELDYQPEEKPNQKPELSLIGVITADIREDYYIRLVKTIETIASENKISVLFCDSEDDEEKEARNIGMMLNRNVDGLIIAPVGFVPYPRPLKTADMPVVLVDRQYDRHDTSFVGINNTDSAARGVDYLAAKGCSRIGFIGYAETVYTMRQRVIGYKLGLMQYLPEQPPFVLRLKYSKEDSSPLIRNFLSEHRPDGIFCGTSDLCYQLVAVVEDMGLRVPEDLRILSYDDNKWMDYLKYPVSVITQPTAEIGRQAVERIITLAENRRIARHTKTEILLDAQIIDRLKNHPSG